MKASEAKEVVPANVSPAQETPRVRDRFWVWGHEAGSHNVDSETDGKLVRNVYNLPAQSRMTPVEAAFYLGVPNAIMVRFLNRPAPPYEILARSFASLRRVVWSVIGDASSTVNNGTPEVEEVVRLAEQHSNFTGAIIDDMHPNRLSLTQFTEMQARLKGLRRPLDLWIVLYAHQLVPSLPPSFLPYYQQSDVLTLWTWKQDDLVQLPATLDRVETVLPGKRKVLGCYLYDYSGAKAMRVENMRRQCEWGLQWLKEGRIEGMIFLASCVCDLGLEAVEWTRRWIAEVGDGPLR